MSSVIIASTNPVKIAATKGGFKAVLPDKKFSFTGISVPSGVSAQPMTDQETLAGATNRAINAQSAHPTADYWVGLEGGIHQVNGVHHSFAWVAVRNKDHLEVSRTATFTLPAKVSQLIDQGIELGFAMDQAYAVRDVKHTMGAVGILTDNLITRTSLYQPAVIIALSRLLDH